MKIAHYVHGIGTRGGVAAYALGLIDAQRARGHEVLVLDGIDDGAADATFVGSKRAIAAAALDAGAEVLHAHDDIAATTIPLPVVRHVHNHNAYCASGSRYLVRSGRICTVDQGIVACCLGLTVEHCGARRPNRIVAGTLRMDHDRRLDDRAVLLANSEHTLAELIDFGYPAERCLRAWCPAGSHGPQATGGRRSTALLVAGRLTAEKGFDRAIEALASVPAVTLTVAGDGPKRADLEALADATGVSSRVTFTGWLQAETMRDTFAEHGALLVPSIWPEPAGMVAYEAMQAGCVVLAAPSGGLIEIVTPAGGLLVGGFEVADWVDGLRTYVALTSDDRERIVDQQQRFIVDHLSMSDHLDVIDDAYASALVRFRRSPPTKRSRR